MWRNLTGAGNEKRKACQVDNDNDLVLLWGNREHVIMATARGTTLPSTKCPLRNQKTWLCYDLVWKGMFYIRSIQHQTQDEYINCILVVSRCIKFTPHPHIFMSNLTFFSYFFFWEGNVYAMLIKAGVLIVSFCLSPRL